MSTAMYNISGDNGVNFSGHSSCFTVFTKFLMATSVCGCTSDCGHYTCTSFTHMNNSYSCQCECSHKSYCRLSLLSASYTLTFPAAEHRRLLPNYTACWQMHVCEQLALSCYLTLYHHHHHLILKHVNRVGQYNYTNKDRHNQAGNCTYSCPEININTSIKHQTVNKAYNIRKHNSKTKVGRS